MLEDVRDVAFRKIAASSWKQIDQADSPAAARRIPNYALNIRFTADGTSVIAHGDDQALHTFILPPDLLDEGKQPHTIIPYASSNHPSNLQSYDTHPDYNLSDPSSTWIIASSREQPIQVRNALDYSYLHSSYPWIHAKTEAFLSAHSLLFLQNRARFAAGTKGRVAIFDVNRPGDEPLTTHNTASRTTSTVQHDTGLVMALAESTDGLLATGSTNRNITLYTASGSGRPEMSFSLYPPLDKTDPCRGNGITSIAWSPCQRYLLIAERQSDCIQIYDVRNGGHRLAYLAGRQANTTQRLNMQIVPTSEKFEVWAGGVDGHARVWTDVGEKEGEIRASQSLHVSDQPIGAVRWHPQYMVMATCTGGRIEPLTVSCGPESPLVRSESSSSDESKPSSLNLSETSSDGFEEMSSASGEDFDDPHSIAIWLPG